MLSGQPSPADGRSALCCRPFCYSWPRYGRYELNLRWPGTWFSALTQTEEDLAIRGCESRQPMGGAALVTSPPQQLAGSTSKSGLESLRMLAAGRWRWAGWSSDCRGAGEFDVFYTQPSPTGSPALQCTAVQRVELRERLPQVKRSP